MTLIIGDQAPDFALPNQNGESIRLSDYRGKKNVVLVFYPKSFTGICTGELCEIRDNISAFQNADVELLAISCDTHFTQKVFAEREGYDFNVLSDFWPHGAVAQAYDVFLPEAGIATRATFVINKAGEIVAKIVTAPGQARDFAEYEKSLQLL